MTLLPALLLLLAALILLLVAQTWPNFNYFWLIAVGIAGLSWVLVVGLRFILPAPGEFQTWIGSEILQPAFRLRWDTFSWQYSLGLATLTLGGMLTEVIRAPGGDWRSWTAGFMLAGTGLLAVQADNLFTLLLGFTAIDLISAGIIFRNSEAGDLSIGFLLSRVAGSGLVLLSGLLVVSNYTGQGLGLLGLLFFLGCGIRLGGPGRGFVSLPLGLGVLYDLVPTVLSLTVILRLTPAVAATTGAQSLYLPLVLLVGVVAGIRWAGHQNQEAERFYWSSSLAAVSTVAALIGQPQAGLVWGLGIIYAGGTLFLYRRRSSWQIVLPVIGLLTVTAVPFSPLAPGLAVFNPPVLPVLYALLPIHGLSLAGYLRQMVSIKHDDRDTERWVLVITPIGLMVLSGTFIVVSLLPGDGLGILRQEPLWPGFVSVLLGALFWWIFRRVDVGGRIQAGMNFLTDLLILVYQPVLTFLRGFSRVMNTLSLILEGQGGILWAFLLIVLILSLISQIDLGGLTIGN